MQPYVPRTAGSTDEAGAAISGTAATQGEHTPPTPAAATCGGCMAEDEYAF